MKILSKIPDTALMLAAGTLAGAVNGFLGTGGGIILVFAFSLLSARRGESGEEAQRDVFASTLVAVLPMSVCSALFYSSAGKGDGALSALLMLPAFIGGQLGAAALERVSGTFVRRLFALLVIWAGLNMVGVL